LKVYLIYFILPLTVEKKSFFVAFGKMLKNGFFMLKSPFFAGKPALVGESPRKKVIFFEKMAPF
jgi:hypothetical protein